MADEPFLLAIETSGATCGICLMHDNELWGEYSVFAPFHHDRLLAELTRRMLTDAGITFTSIKIVAVNAGPGSFTGLRVGAAFAKSLSFDFEGESAPKLIAVPALEAFACAAEEFAQATSSNSTIAVIHSHRNIIYSQSFSSDLQTASAIELTTVEEISSTISEHDIVCGTGAPLLQKGLQLSGLNRLTPRFIARLGKRLHDLGNKTDPLNFTPLYVQDFIPKSEK